MKVFVVLCAIILSMAKCSVLTNPAFVRSPNLDSAVVRTVQVGGNFAYSTQENHAYLPLSQPITYQLPLSYSISPFYSQPFYGSSLLTAPFYSGLLPSPIFGQPSLLGSSPFLPQSPVQNPIFGQIPSQLPAVSPALNPQGPTQIPPVRPAEPNAELPQNDVPTQGVTIEDDTISVEAAK